MPKPKTFTARCKAQTFQSYLIGCPIRITVGEKNLKEGMVELKLRKQRDNRLISFTSLTSLTRPIEFWDLIKDV